MENALQPGLYIVATPIGNPRDITLRALDTLQKADVVICEEIREGSTLLKRLGISGKELVSLNEHNETENIPELLTRLARGQALALVSDGGTPVFADPGYHLIARVTEMEFKVIPLPGASSLMTALSILDFHLKRFYFAGFLPPKTEFRQKELEKLKTIKIPIILMDTPYRLSRLLEEVKQVFGGKQRITLACNLTMPGEHIYRGTVTAVLQQVGKRKAEFILILHT